MLLEYREQRHIIYKRLIYQKQHFLEHLNSYFVDGFEICLSQKRLKTLVLDSSS